MYGIFPQIDTYLYLPLKNAWLPLIFFFFYSINPCQEPLFPCSYKPHKNISVLAGTTDRKLALSGYR